MQTRRQIKLEALLLAGALLMVWLASFTLGDGLVYKQGQIIDLKIPCYTNGSYCSVAATCDLTVQLPNGTILIDNQAMTYNPSYFNYTLESNQTREIGNYPCSMVCVDGSDSGHKDFTFEITTTGAGNEWLINLIAFILIVIAIVIFVIGLNRQDWVITMLSSFIFGIVGFNLYFFPLVYLPEIVNSILAWVLWGIGSYILLRTSIEVAGGALGNG